MPVACQCLSAAPACFFPVYVCMEVAAPSARAGLRYNALDPFISFAAHALAERPRRAPSPSSPLMAGVCVELVNPLPTPEKRHTQRPGPELAQLPIAVMFNGQEKRILLKTARKEKSVVADRNRSVIFNHLIGRASDELSRRHDYLSVSTT